MLEVTWLAVKEPRFGRTQASPRAPAHEHQVALHLG